MGLGSLDDVTLAEAREIARDYRKLIKQGIDPIGHRNALVAQNLAKSAAVMTFDQAAEAYIRQHRAGWKNLDHANQWQRSLKTHASPVLGRMSVVDITTAHVMRVLDPIWQVKTETANRARGRIEAVLGWATVSGYRSGDNPARWRDHLDNLLAPRSKVRAVKHQPALPYAEMPAFMVDLHKRKGMAALALEFAILTCVRSEDVVKAKRTDIDRTARMWVIPAFTKTAAEHRVPLSTAALAVFDKARKSAGEIGGEVGRSEFAFPNDVTGKHLSSNALLGVIERIGLKGTATTHGFRATFRTWTQEQTNFPWELPEIALGHKVGTKVERAYARGDAFKKRVAIMQAWADYCTRPRQPGKVIALQQRRNA
jgi:integrase